MQGARRVAVAYVVLILFLVVFTSSPPVRASSVTRLPLGGFPWGIALDTANGHFYVANTGYISVVDPATNTRIRNITVGPDAQGLPSSLTEMVYDNATNKIIVLDGNLPGLWIVDPATNTAVKNTTLGANYNIVYRFMTAAAGKLFVTVDSYSAGKNSFMLVFDESTISLLANVTMPAGAYPQMSAYDPTNNRIYVAQGNLNETTVFDVNTYAVVAHIPTPNGPYATTYGAGAVFVTESSTNLIAVINASTGQLAKTLTGSLYPVAILYVQDPFILAFSQGSDRVQVWEWGQGTTVPGAYFNFTSGLFEMAFDPLVSKGVFCGTYSTNSTSGQPGGIECVYDPFSSFTTTTTNSSTATTPSSTTTSSTSASTTSTTTYSSASSSSSSSSASTSSSSTSSSSETTGPASTPGNDDFLLVGIGLAAALAVAGYLLWRRSQTSDEHPTTREKPIGSPPTIPPYVPPPVIPGTVEHLEENEGCDCGEKEKDSAPRTDIEVSKHWDQKYDEDTGKGDLEQAIEDSIKTKGGWDREAVGTAVAHSEGATFGASVDAGAKIWIMEGDQRRLSSTNKLDVSSEGETEIEIEVEAPKEAKTTVSAAVLAAVKAHASVLDVNASIFENLETFDFFEKFFTVLLNLAPPRANHPEELKKELDEVKKVLDSIKEAAKESTTGEEYRELLKEAKDISRALLKDLGAELTAEIVIPMLIEKVGRWLWVNADVDVEVEGKFDVTVGTCGTQTIDAMASRKLEVKSGEIEEPLGDEYTESHSRKIVESCSAPRELKILIKGEGKASGQAYDGGEGNAYLDSLWAAAWVCCCQTEAGEKRNNFGFTFKALFTIPPEVEEKHQDVESGVMRKTIINWMRNDLQARLDGAAIPCSFDDPKPTEEKLKDILTKWMDATAKEWHIFT